MILRGYSIQGVPSENPSKGPLNTGFDLESLLGFTQTRQNGTCQRMTKNNPARFHALRPSPFALKPET